RRRRAARAAPACDVREGGRDARRHPRAARARGAAHLPARPDARGGRRRGAIGSVAGGFPRARPERRRARALRSGERTMTRAALVAGLVSLVACSPFGPRPDPTRFYVLAPSTPETSPAPPDGLTIGLGPV